MTSTENLYQLNCPSKNTLLDQVPRTTDNDNDDTEDEEVKINCLAGVRHSYHDSDMDSTPCQDSESEDEGGDQGDGVVEFVSERVGLTRSPVVRPQATSPERLQGSPRGDDDDAGDSRRRRPGARGIPLSFADSDQCESLEPEEEEDDDDEEEDEEEEEDSDKLLDPNEVTTTECIDYIDPAYLAENEEDSTGDQDDEIASILEACDGDKARRLQPSGLDDSDSFDHQIGVTQDRVCVITNLPKSKRLLSCNTLATLNVDAGHNDDSPKRVKLDGPQSLPQSERNEFADFSLGPPAVSQTTQDEEQPRRNMYTRRGESCVSSDEELDRQLEEELGGFDERSRENTPVPLLTPPASPLALEIEGDNDVVCEWPSNLTIDNAMTAILSEIRPMSPHSLENFELEDDERLQQEWKAKSSSLTPLLKGFSVSIYN